MPSIDIRREHSKSVEEARSAVERLAGKIAERFDVEHHWKGDTLHFTRSGVDGQIALAPGEVRVVVNLSFFLLAMRGPIESEIHKQIDREFV